MNHTGFFFCGLLVGVVVSAAFGLDFFPVPRDTGPGLTSLNPPASGSSEKPSEATVGASAQAVRDLDARLEETSKTLRRKESELAALQDRLKAPASGGIRDGDEAPEPGQSLLEAERLRADRLQADLELSRQETYNLLKRFFASERGPEHAILVSEYFATSAPEELKGDLVDQLLESNRSVIAALSPVSSLAGRSQTAESGGASGGLTTVSAAADASRPERAILKPDEPETRDRRETSDSSDAHPGGAPANPQKALELPSPPGE